MSSSFKTSDKAQKSSYMFVNMLVKSKKPYYLVETLILPVCKEIFKIMINQEGAKEIENNTYIRQQIRSHVVLMVFLATH